MYLALVLCTKRIKKHMVQRGPQKHFVPSMQNDHSY